MISVAIDGPAGAGKSTIAKALAQRFSLIHVDTGAIYRAVALYFLQQGQNPADPAVVVPQLPDISVRMAFSEQGQRMLLQGQDVTGLIRTPEVSMGASAVSAIPEVRAFLLEQQRQMARENNVIMDGRDIGTVVLPDATVKIFLTASAEERARRRHLELLEKGTASVYQEVLADVVQRDHQDATRAIAPLRQAPDAVLVDTSSLNFDQAVEAMADIIRQRINA